MVGIPHTRPDAGRVRTQQIVVVHTAAAQIRPYCPAFPLATDAGPITDMCIDKQTLGAAFLNAIRDLHALLLAHGGTLVESETGLVPFETALNLARERRDKAKLAFIAHIHAHGC